MAWWLGMWLTDGAKDRPSISQGGPPPPHPNHHGEVIGFLLAYEGLFGERVEVGVDQYSTAGHPAYWFNYGADSLAGRVLEFYGLYRNQHIPRALLVDSLGVRRRLLAGLIDGDGHYDLVINRYEMPAKELAFLTGVKELAATLGLRNDAIQPHDGTHPATGQVYSGHRLFISGDMWDVTQYCAASYKQSRHPDDTDYLVPNKNARCYGLTITPQPAGEYFGFAVGGGVNRRFLLEDYTVTHNVRPAALPCTPTLCSRVRWTLRLCCAALCDSRRSSVRMRCWR